MTRPTRPSLWPWAAALLQLLGARGQDLSVYGVFSFYNVPVDAINLQQIYSKCFEGMAMETCVPKLPSEVTSYQALLPYYRDLASQVGQSYCLQCCGEPINYRDVWDLYCEVDDSTRTAANLYGYELRLATNRYNGDTGHVWCPLRRSACTYTSAGKTISCDRTNDHTFLVGYTVTIEVTQYSENFKYWRGASKCSIQTFESPWPLNATQTFHETIIMNHVPASYPNYTDNSKLLFLLLFIYVLVYGSLYACRTKQCCYCQQKLVWSRSLCLKCRFVGAQPPDPVLLKMMEEKGARLQGDMPEPLPTKGLWQWIGRRTTKGVKVLPTLFVQTYSESKLSDAQDVMSDVRSLSSLENSSVNGESPDRRAGSQKKNRKGWLAKRDNPNALRYDREIIGAAVGHHHYRKADIIKPVTFNPTASP